MPGGTGVYAWRGVGGVLGPSAHVCWAGSAEPLSEKRRPELTLCDLDGDKAQGRHWGPLSGRFHSRTQELARALSPKAGAEGPVRSPQEEGQG